MNRWSNIKWRKHQEYKKIQQLLQYFFNDKELNEINPNETVSYKTAIKTTTLTGTWGKVTDDILLFDISPLTLLK